MNKSLIYLVSVFLVVFFFNGCKNKKTDVLIIGDSISIGYTPHVIKYFSEKATIVHNKGNAQHTGNGLEKIEEWLGDKNWDIIQFNWGLWDMCYRNPDAKTHGNRDKLNGKITFSLEEYSSNLEALINTIKTKTNAKLIYVTTTYVPENEIGRFKDDALKYNEAAKAVMKKHNIIVNELYNESLSIHKKHGKESNDVHYTKEGYKALSKTIITFLENHI